MRSTRLLGRSFSVALLGAVVAAVAGISGEATAADGCDALPTSAPKLVEVRSVTDSLCNVACNDWPAAFPKPNAPLSAGSNIGPGGSPKIEYVDSWHGACQIKMGTGTFCKQDTTCTSGTRIQEGGVWKCEGKKTETQTFNPRQDCKSGATPPVMQYNSTAAAVPVLKRAKEVLYPAGTKGRGTRECVFGGGGDRTFKGMNLHLVDQIKTDDPAITGFVKMNGVPNEATVDFQAGPTARVGAHTFELLAFNGRQKVQVTNFGVIENDSTASCPAPFVRPGPLTGKSCTGPGPCN